MEDSAPVLLNGNGTPYLAIFDGAESPIMDKLNDLPIGMEVTNFKYKYSEDKGDSGEFTIETNNVDIVDEPSLQYKMPLRLQWGWLFSDGSSKRSPVRLVNISDHKIEFTPDGTKFTIKFKDAKKFLEDEPPAYFADQTDYLKYMQQLAMGKIHIQILDYAQKPGMKPVILEKVDCDGKREQRAK